MTTTTETTRLTWPADSPELLPFLPLIYVAWSDGVLTDEELEAICGRIEEQEWLAAEDRARLRSWLDPEAPPSPASLERLRERVRSIGTDAEGTARRSLVELGLALARSEGLADPACAEGTAREAVDSIEDALGVIGGEAARKLTDTEVAVPAARREAPFDVERLADFLSRPHGELRSRVLALLAEPDFVFPFELDRPTYRRRVLEAVRRLAEEGMGAFAYDPAGGGEGDAGKAIAVFETLAFGDQSVLVKFGVQFGLFGGSIQQLGTRRHHETYLPRVASLELPGCFAMTEIDHGSNVRGIETEAVYDAETQEIVVHTPHPGAGKHWIGNAARDGRMATVFAQLTVGEEEHGVHAVLVPIRGEDGSPLEGVRIADNGPKEGLNGVDNGQIWLDRVRVPRTNLLDRFASITEEGLYESSIPSAGRRFFTMLGTLVAGRISVAAASTSVAKTGLTIAVRYSAVRRQFGPEGAAEVPILDYLVQQRLLLTRLAATYGLHFACRDLAGTYAERLVDDAGAAGGEEGAAGGTGTDGEAGGRHENGPDGEGPEGGSPDSSGPGSPENGGGSGSEGGHGHGPGMEDGFDPGDESRESLQRRIEVEAAGLKAYASRHCIDTLQACREALGGEGYDARNRFGRLKADTDVFATFEGANVVLLQLVSRGLLSEFREQMGDLKLWDMLKYIADRASTRVGELNPVVTRRTDEDHLRDADFHAAAFRYREERLLTSVARRLKTLIDEGTDSFEAMNVCQDHLVTLARAHVETRVLEAFHRAVKRAPTPGLSEVLRSLASLWALERLEQHRGWYLESGYFEAAKSKAVRSQVNALCREVSEHAVFLVDAFGIPDTVLRAPAGVAPGIRGESE